MPLCLPTRSCIPRLTVTVWITYSETLITPVLIMGPTIEIICFITFASSKWEDKIYWRLSIMLFIVLKTF